MDSMFHLWRISFARSMMIFRRASRMSSILSKLTLALQGPTRFMFSQLAAICAELTPLQLVVYNLLYSKRLGCSPKGYPTIYLLDPTVNFNRTVASGSRNQ